MENGITEHELRRVVGTRSRALYRYHQMTSRCRNGNRCLHKKKGIKVLVDKEDFIKWFMERDFEGCAVDRIDNNGHYILSNMQVIKIAENIGKDKRLTLKNGMIECNKCGEVKSIKDMAVDKRTYHGVRSTCKVCDNVEHHLRAMQRD